MGRYRISFLMTELSASYLSPQIKDYKKYFLSDQNYILDI